MGIESITGRARPPVTNGSSPVIEVDSGSKVAPKSTEKTDSVAITATAQELKKAFETTSSETVVDMDRVAAVKKALDDGSYRIDAEKIAGKMIQHEKLMSRK